MARTYKLPHYVLYLDTNAAYSKKPSESISGKLLRAVEEARTLTQIDVRLPEVVLEELAYQQFVIAVAAKENLQKNYKTLLDVCGLKPSKPLELENLKTCVRALVSQALQKGNLSKVRTPVENIDWASVIEDSCWRRAPFEKPKSDDDLAEKGFRDKVILETIKVDALNVKDGVVAFLSGDGLLRSAFKDQVKGTCPTEAYANVSELVGHLELLAKTKSTAFTNEVLSKVGAFFYAPDDPACVAISQGVIQKLATDYDEEMSRPPLFSLNAPTQSDAAMMFPSPTPTRVPSTSATNWFEEFQNWSPVTSVNLFASPPVFQPDSNDGRYHWKSTVTLVRLLRRTTPRAGQAYGLPEERVRTKEIDVKWSCKIHPDSAQFSDPLVEGCTPTFRDGFLNADFHSRSMYGLPLFPSLEEPSN
jgi:hypothetical protein